VRRPGACRLGALLAPQRDMRNLSHASRLVTAGAASSAICAAAGIIAFTGPAALGAASALLVIATVTAMVGYAYADNRNLGWAALLIVAATLPLFGVLYVAGKAMMTHLGPTVTGGSLVALSVAVAAGTIGLLGRIVSLTGGLKRGAPRAPSER
jgi:hypothetical protein